MDQWLIPFYHCNDCMKYCYPVYCNFFIYTMYFISEVAVSMCGDICSHSSKVHTIPVVRTQLLQSHLACCTPLLFQGVCVRVHCSTLDSLVLAKASHSGSDVQTPTESQRWASFYVLNSHLKIFLSVCSSSSQILKSRLFFQLLPHVFLLWRVPLNRRIS